MSHNQSAIDGNTKRIVWAILLNIFITIVQIVGGILSGSLSLLSDALHNFSDAVALLLSGFAYRISQKPHTHRYTFGYKRAEILAAAFNAFVLVAIGVLLIKEAIDRFFVGETPSGMMMVVVGLFGLLGNIGGVLLLHSNIHNNLNFRSAYLHLLSDAVSSIAIVIGGVCILFWNLSWIDPLLTILIALYVSWESFDILRNAVRIIMMAAPAELSLEYISNDIASLPGVHNVHHAHLWQLSDTDIHFEAHVCVPDMTVSETQQLLDSIESVLLSKYSIRHVTIQFEVDKCTSSELIYESRQTHD